MRLRTSFLILSALSLSGCVNMMVDSYLKADKQMAAMMDGTQAEYIESLGGKSAFGTLDAEKLSNLCSMYAQIGKINTYLECSEVYLQRFGDSSEPLTHYLAVGAHYGMAASFISLGRNEEASVTIDKGLALIEEKNQRESLIYGEIIRMTEVMLNAYKAVVAHKLGDTDTKAKALAFVDQSMPWMKEQKSYRLAYRRQFAPVYFALGDYDKAAEFAVELPEEEPSAWDKFTQVKDAVMTLGVSEVMKKQGEEVVAEAKQSFDISLYYVGRANYEAQRYNEALTNFKNLESYDSISKDFTLHWMYWFDYGRTYLALGDREQAIAIFEKSIEVIESQRSDFNSEMGKMGFARGKQQVYAQMIRTLLDAGNKEEAFAYVERAKARALVDLLAEREYTGLSDAPEASQYLAQLQKIESKVQPTAPGTKVATNQEGNTRSLARIPKEQLKTKYPELSSLISVDTISSTQASKLLKKGEMLLEYYVDGDDLYAFVIESGQLKVYSLNGKELEENVRAYRKALTQSKSEWKKPSIALYKQLIRPFGRRVRNKNLVIVPHGPLHYLPFASLYDGKSYMAEKARIRLMPSASVMDYVGKNIQSTEQMMILGNPDLHNPDTDLPGAEKEAKVIAGLWSGADVRLRSQATETVLKSNSTNYGMFHFASHGVFDPVNPLESGLLLAADEQNDGRLTVAEIYGIRLNADLVTLSACETGLGDIVSGDDVVGLNRGFLYAGADSILSSLWPVEDEPTAYFMQSFYGYLKKNDKAKALQLAQLKTRKKYSHPSRWAAFQLTGASE